eukprot:1180252-Prorocentrum_minimum.AAC.5
MLLGLMLVAAKQRRRAGSAPSSPPPSDRRCAALANPPPALGPEDPTHCTPVLRTGLVLVQGTRTLHTELAPGNLLGGIATLGGGGAAGRSTGNGSIRYRQLWRPAVPLGQPRLWMLLSLLRRRVRQPPPWPLRSAPTNPLQTVGNHSSPSSAPLRATPTCRPWSARIRHRPLTLLQTVAKHLKASQTVAARRILDSLFIPRVRGDVGVGCAAEGRGGGTRQFVGGGNRGSPTLCIARPCCRAPA